MKLSNLSVIFVIIMIPIILILSYYISLQVDTINMQTSYNSKLLDATKEAIEAFEINTVEWNEAYSQAADSKRRDILASINTFTTSFANSLGVGGTNRENLLTYVPAIAFTLYDGYYIYSPAETVEVIKDNNGVAVVMSEKLLYMKKDDGSNILQGYSGKIKEDSGRILYQVEDGSPSDGTYNGQPFTLNLDNAKKTNSHILKPFSSYSERYTNGNTDIIVNYTLDNYITIYGTVDDGTVDGKYVVQSGYLIDTDNIPEVKKETLTEKIAWKDNDQNDYTTGTYTYIYTENNTKVYFMNDPVTNKEKPYTINSNGIRTALEATKTGVVYKKLSIKSKNGENYYEIYQALTSSNDDRNIEAGKWYTDKNGTIYEGNDPLIDIKEDTSSINYYVESEIFSKWVKSKLSNIPEISSDDNPENEDSVFNMHKREVIKEALISDLNQAITAYSRNPEGEYREYQLPVLTERDWDQILRNVSITTFVQGIPIGMKTYNNYAVATSTTNKEYVNPDEIYLNGSDSYYHLPGCNKLEGNNIIGYRNVDYKLKSYNDRSNHNIDDADTKYYYRHNMTTNDNSNDSTRQECYYCLVQRELFDSATGDNYTKQETAYKTALARERYNNRTTRIDTLKAEIVPEPTQEAYNKGDVLVEYANDLEGDYNNQVNVLQNGYYEITLIAGGGGGRNYTIQGVATTWLGGGSGAGFSGIVELEQGLYNYQVGKGGKKVNSVLDAASGNYDKSGGTSSFGNKIELSGGLAGAIKRNNVGDLGGKSEINVYNIEYAKKRKYWRRFYWRKICIS